MSDLGRIVRFDAHLGCSVRGGDVDPTTPALFLLRFDQFNCVQTVTILLYLTFTLLMLGHPLLFGDALVSLPPLAALLPAIRSGDVDAVKLELRRRRKFPDTPEETKCCLTVACGTALGAAVTGLPPAAYLVVTGKSQLVVGGVVLKGVWGPLASAGVGALGGTGVGARATAGTAPVSEVQERDDTQGGGP